MPDWIYFAQFDWPAALLALAAVVIFALAGWALSLVRRDVSIVDSLWSLMFLVSLGTYVYASGHSGWRTWLVIGLAAIWALRLSIHITRRGWGEPEDRRYRQIRANHQPNFHLKSVYIVFGLQAALAWIISLPMLAAASVASAPGLLDAVGIGLWLAGMFFEWVGDAQLARFKRNPVNRGKVMARGLWRYTRHPNYFGEFLLQWGFFLIAAGAAGAWTVFAPLLITYLLLRVSGVALLEKDIGQRRPEYREYVRSTNAFFPGRPKEPVDHPLFIALVLALLLPWLQVPAQAAEANREWHFEVLVDDKPLGHHRFYLEQEGSTRRVRSVADFEYRLLFVKLYDYEHENQEIWEGSCLRRIESSTNANGKRYAVDGQRKPGAFVVESGDQSQVLPECVRSFAYWNPEFLNSPHLLNSQNGEFVEVALSEGVADEIQVNGNTVDATRYRLDAGEVQIDLWYTADSRWVGLETRPREGRSLRYVLR